MLTNMLLTIYAIVAIAILYAFAKSWLSAKRKPVAHEPVAGAKMFDYPVNLANQK
jgi:hypothetical protein